MSTGVTVVVPLGHKLTFRKVDDDTLGRTATTFVAQVVLDLNHPVNQSSEFKVTLLQDRLRKFPQKKGELLKKVNKTGVKRAEPPPGVEGAEPPPGVERAEHTPGVERAEHTPGVERAEPPPGVEGAEPLFDARFAAAAPIFVALFDRSPNVIPAPYLLMNVKKYHDTKAEAKNPITNEWLNYLKKEQGKGFDDVLALASLFF